VVERPARRSRWLHDGGYWVVSTHADIKEVSRRSDVFSSGENTAVSRFRDDIERDQIEMQRVILLNKDAPEHTKLRRLVSRGFTPRAINSLQQSLNDRARRIVERRRRLVTVTS